MANIINRQNTNNMSIISKIANIKFQHRFIERPDAYCPVILSSQHNEAQTSGMYNTNII